MPLVFQHRFGGSLNLNTHLHAVVVDGVFEKVFSPTGDEQVRFHPLPPPEPVDLAALAYDVYRQFLTWLKKRGVNRLTDVDETFDDEDGLASCLRGSLGIGKVVQVTVEGDLRATEEDLNAQRFALRRSPQVGEFGGFGVHAGVTVHAPNRVPGSARGVDSSPKASVTSLLRRIRTALLMAEALRAEGFRANRW